MDERQKTLNLLNSILDKIANNEEVDNYIDKLSEKLKYVDLDIKKEEIRTDRLKEYIKFFNLSGYCEYNIFEDHSEFYDLLRENLPKEEWKKIDSYLDSGSILTYYRL